MKNLTTFLLLFLTLPIFAISNDPNCGDTTKTDSVNSPFGTYFLNSINSENIVYDFIVFKQLSDNQFECVRKFKFKNSQGEDDMEEYVQQYEVVSFKEFELKIKYKSSEATYKIVKSKEKEAFEMIVFESLLVYLK